VLPVKNNVPFCNRLRIDFIGYGRCRAKRQFVFLDIGEIWKEMNGWKMKPEADRRCILLEIGKGFLSAR
jgi:hypothetical protein